MNEPCCLVLSDGRDFPGYSFGAPPPLPEELTCVLAMERAAGEVVFNTGMCGYHEILTDPSYTGQIVVMTYPMIGNYGVDESWNESESRGCGGSVRAAGFVVRSLYTGPVPAGRKKLAEFLAETGTPGIRDVDTRALTLRLRDEGSANGVIVRPGEGSTLSEDERGRVIAFLSRFPSMEGRNLVDGVGTPSAKSVKSEGHPMFAVVDTGVKSNIVRELVARNVDVSLHPSTATSEEILKGNPDAVLFSNGPGDPAVLERIVASIREMLGHVAVCGICMGHQLIAQALGATTRKMKFGHHGVNHPVRDERTGRVFVTSQNHGFDVDEESLRPDVFVRFKNANDGTVEGIEVPGMRVMTVQFHPEAAPGPRDSGWVFDAFVETALKEGVSRACAK